MELRKTEEAQLERLNLKEAVLSSDELLNHNYLIAKQKHNRCTNMCCNIREVIEDIKFCPNCGREIDKSLNLFFRDSRDEVMKFMEWHFYINQREEDRKENGHLIEEVEKSRFVDVSEFDEAKVLMYNPCLDEFVPVEPREALTGHEQALLDTCDNIINDLPPFSLVNVLETARLFLKEGTDIEIDSKGGVRPAVTANDQERGLIELAKDISAYTEFTPLHIMEDIKNIQQNLSLKPVNLNTLQAFKNATQAIKENEQNPKIEVKVSSDKNTVKITVSDNGKGITDKNKELIFEPKFTTKTSGMGLGLPMIKNIIEAYDGSISFTSKEDIGTVFTVILPKT